MALYVDFDDLTHDATKRLLKQAMMHQMVAQVPVHKRPSKRRQMQEIEDEASEHDEYGKQADYDREQLADLKEKSGKPSVIRVTVHDLASPVKKAMERQPKTIKAKGGKPKKI